jgi:hypothetical protein
MFTHMFLGLGVTKHEWVTSKPNKWRRYSMHVFVYVSLHVPLRRYVFVGLGIHTHFNKISNFRSCDFDYFNTRRCLSEKTSLQIPPDTWPSYLCGLLPRPEAANQNRCLPARFRYTAVIVCWGQCCTRWYDWWLPNSLLRITPIWNPTRMAG